MERLYVVKIGGNIIDNAVALDSFLKNFAQLQGISKSKFILVHGGGKLATKLAADLGVEQKMVEGRRITDAETLKIVTMVYTGYINKNIVAQLQGLGVNAAGFSGADGNIIKAHKREVAAIDYGFAGDIDWVNTATLSKLLTIFDTLVIAPITHNAQGQLLNTNADTIAQELATALTSSYSVELIFSFEKDGVLLEVDQPESLIQQLNKKYYTQLKEEGKIFAGMIPKLDNAFSALDKGVQAVWIGKAESLHALIAGDTGTKIIHE